MTEQTAPKTVEVTLEQAHTHQRTAYDAGEKIHVRPHVADYLEQHKIGKRTTNTKA